MHVPCEVEPRNGRRRRGASWAIPCSGTTVYAPRHRAVWLAEIVEPGVRLRAEHLYRQLDSLQPLRLECEANSCGRAKSMGR
jgi:hypothetical protein